ncbi:MAG: ATPase [Alphaproteobacteria bacterium]|jgi:chaperone required for assembly of F1-ATPase|nr:ATPase [Alphaproteobacteria bacterium]
MKRFYKETAVDACDGGFRVLLDGRPMRTPAKTVLVVPTRALAEAIAGEWAGVPEKEEIKTALLPLTRLAATGLDRVPGQREQVIDDTAKYAGSDLLCYRASGPSSLVERQKDTWQPLLDWAAERYGARLAVVEGMSFVTQSPEALVTLRAAVAAHGDMALSSLYNLTHIAGSLIVALAVAERRLTAEDAFAAAQLDDLYQVERWGDDPTALEQRTGVRRDIVAGSRFLELLEGTRLRTKGEA